MNIDKYMTADTAFEIAVHEGIVPAPYFDAVRVLTFGVGHTRHAGPPDPAKMPMSMPSGTAREEAIRYSCALLAADMPAYIRPIVEKLGDTLEDHELAGWAAWNFNTGGIYKTSAVSQWRAGDKAGAVRTLQSWNKITVGGEKVVSSALAERRAQEAALILDGVWHTSGSVPVWKTNGWGRVIWRPIDNVTFDELAALSRLPKRGKTDTLMGPAAGIGALLAALIGAVATFWDKITGFF